MYIYVQRPYHRIKLFDHFLKDFEMLDKCLQGMIEMPHHETCSVVVMVLNQAG